MVDSKLILRAAEGIDSLDAIFNKALGAMVKGKPHPEVEARFYPYAGLSSTIRLRKGRVYARVSDVLEKCPPEVLYALACILVAKLYRLRTPKEHESVYRQYTARPEISDASERARRARGYKLTTTPHGKVYDLETAFEGLNVRYFEGKLERPVLSWSRGKTRRVLGHCDHTHGTIIISRTLDSPGIPGFVLEYVLYHEMLHVKHPPRSSGGRTIYHGPEFRADEIRYERYDESIQWLERLAVPARRRRKKTR